MSFLEVRTSCLSFVGGAAFFFLEQGLSGLHHAAIGGHSKCFSCLLQHGADPTLCTMSGDNALDVARKHGKPRAISRAGMSMQQNTGVDVRFERGVLRIRSTCH